MDLSSEKKRRHNKLYPKSENWVRKCFEIYGFKKISGHPSLVDFSTDYQSRLRFLCPSFMRGGLNVTHPNKSILQRWLDFRFFYWSSGS